MWYYGTNTSIGSTVYWTWYIRIVRPGWVQMQLITENTQGVQQPRPNGGPDVVPVKFGGGAR